MSAESALKCRRFKDPVVAFGRAVNLLMRTQPFASYPFGKFSKVLLGQIQRGHYVFTIDGDTPVGYVGWAMCTEAVARAWLEEHRVPRYEECNGGDCWVGITFYAATREACFFQARHLRQRYPDAKAMGIRDYGERRRPAIARNTTPILAAGSP